MPGLPAATNDGQWARVRPGCAAQPGGRGRGRGGEPTWAVTAPSQIQQPAHQRSLHCQWHVLSLRKEYPGQSNARPRLRRSQSSSTVPRTRHAIRPAPPSHFALLDRIGCSQWHESAAACSRLQRVPSAAGLLTGGTRLQRSARGATQCAALLRHTCVAQRQMSRRAAVAAQVSAGHGFSYRQVGKGSTQSQCRGGRV